MAFRGPQPELDQIKASTGIEAPSQKVYLRERSLVASLAQDQGEKLLEQQ